MQAKCQPRGYEIIRRYRLRQPPLGRLPKQVQSAKIRKQMMKYCIRTDSPQMANRIELSSAGTRAQFMVKIRRENPGQRKFNHEFQVDAGSPQSRRPGASTLPGSRAPPCCRPPAESGSRSVVRTRPWLGAGSRADRPSGPAHHLDHNVERQVADGHSPASHRGRGEAGRRRLRLRRSAA